MISDAGRDYLRLSLVPGVGAYTAQQLIAHCGSARQVWQHHHDAWREIAGVGPKLIHMLKLAQKHQFEAEIAALIQQCKTHQIQIVCPVDECWPKGLLACDDAPLVLYAKGQRICLQSNQVLAMVGARKATAEGKMIARRWSAYCSSRGVCVVSGMAPGIDAAAHGGSLDANQAGIAVLGYGLAAGSSQQQQQIEAMAEKGCVLSEYAPDKGAFPAYFPQRNRIIAGIAHALLVIEGGVKSGSLISARHALNYGREVFAVPGSVLNDVHAGCHQLIQDGAGLVDDADFILRTMGWSIEKITTSTYEPTSEIERTILKLLAKQVKHIDSLAEDCRLTVPELSTIVLRLEMQGVIEKLPGSRYTLA